MNEWEGISEQDRGELERLSLATGVNLSALRLGFRMGRIAGLDEAVRGLVSGKWDVSVAPHPETARITHAH